MAKTFHNLAASLHRTLRSNRGQQAVYARGADQVELEAVAGSTQVEQADDAGAAVQSRRTDWILLAADLVLGGQAVWPQVGDRLTLSESGEVYEVQPLAGEHARACDETRTTVRVHTRLIAES